ncbi:MAG TPA: META domain-containing protein [Myxococcota bacterium]|nr:META domain-containing protein [Myxococcota bacterium]
MRGSRIWLVLALLALSACEPPPTAQSPLAPVHDWRLTRLGERSDVPDGQSGPALTLLFDTAKAQVSGFAGCNRFAGGYTLNGAQLRFGPLAVTRMACEKGMELEGAYLAALAAADQLHLSGGELELVGPEGAKTALRFRPLQPPP